MGKKFDEIYESIASRTTSGGYLPGDIVTFRQNYKSCDSYKSLPSKIRQDLDEMVKSGLNIKVVQVGNNLSGVSGNNQDKLPTNTVITVAADHGGGRWYSTIAVSPEMIDLAENDGVNLPKIPDQFRRDDKVNYKPEKFKRDDKFITNVTDKGNGKNTPTQINLAGESTMIKNDMANLANLYTETLNMNMSKKDQDNIAKIYVENFRDGPGYGEEFYSERDNAAKDSKSPQHVRDAKSTINRLRIQIDKILSQPVNQRDPFKLEELQELLTLWRDNYDKKMRGEDTF